MPIIRVSRHQAQMEAGAAFLGENLPPLQNDIVHYPGQFIAVIVAETYEQARTAAYKLKVRYTVEKGAVDLRTELPNSIKPKVFLGEEANIFFVQGIITDPLDISIRALGAPSSCPETNMYRSGCR